MRLRCTLRHIRGDQPIRDFAEQTGVHRGTLSMIELGRLLPTDEQIPLLEAAYGVPFEDWYGSDLAARRLLLALESDEGVKAA